MASSVSQLPSLRTSVANSSKSLVSQETVISEKKLESGNQNLNINKQINLSDGVPVTLSVLTDIQENLTIESLFEDCQKCNGLIGVPITYMASHCDEQMEIIGHAHGDAGVALGITPYPRELKRLNKGLRDGDFYIIKDGIPIIPYNRIVIRRRKEYI